MEVGVAGCGAVARRYVDGIDNHPKLTLVGVADPAVDRAETLAGVSGCGAYANVGDLLAEETPDLVVNLTSHREHAPVSRACLEAGAGVFSEKPLAVDPHEAAVLVDVAERAGLGLGCAPHNHEGAHQRVAARRLADGTLGDVGVVTATAHVGRVTDWHDRPDSYLAVGPLYTGAVYPLTLLVEWFGPVSRVRTADTVTRYPARAAVEPAAPTHVEATLDLGDGPLVRLTASFYVPHRAREFYGVEVHGDDGSLYLEDAGDVGGGRTPLVAVGGVGREYTPVPLQRPGRERSAAESVATLAAASREGRAAVTSARRAAHVVAVCDAIEAAADGGGPVTVADCGFVPGSPPAEPVRPPALDADDGPAAGTAALRLPPIGFGCSQYRDGTYVDRRASIETALDAGYRLFDSAELYGNEARLGERVAAPGSPTRDSLFLVSKVWNTNHGHVREACETTLSALGVDTLDAYLLHWPRSWAYTGPLQGLAELAPEGRERKTFPTAEGGEPVPGGVPLEEAWRRLESVHHDGLARTIGLCNVDRATLREVLDVADVPPTMVQLERHPYRPRDPLVSFCHERGIRVVAHSPLSAPGLLDDSAVRAAAEAHEVSPAQAVLAWNVQRGVVPIPSSVTPGHVVENAAAAGVRLEPESLERLDGLADPSFER